MRPTKLVPAALPVLLGLSAAQAHAQLVINPTYDASITSSPNAAAIEQGIQNSINVYETMFTNKNTINITFQSVATGLGESSTFINTVNYQDYATALHANEPGQPFLQSVPIQATNPVNGSTTVQTTLADLRTLGFAGNTIATDSTISLYTGIMNLSRNGTPDPDKYDLQSVTMHEIDEVLGLGSTLNGLNNGDAAPTGAIGSEDLFRYTANGTRSFDTGANTAAFFSADGGVTDISRFNQQQGGDFQDWYSYPFGAANPQVQDAFSTPGQQVNLDSSEITALKAVGYNLAAPEPSQTATLALGALGLGGLVFKARRRKALTV